MVEIGNRKLGVEVKLSTFIADEGDLTKGIA